MIVLKVGHFSCQREAIFCSSEVWGGIPVATNVIYLRCLKSARRGAVSFKMLCDKIHTHETVEERAVGRGRDSVPCYTAQ